MRLQLITEDFDFKLFIEMETVPLKGDCFDLSMFLRDEDKELFKEEKSLLEFEDDSLYEVVEKIWCKDNAGVYCEIWLREK